MTLGCVYWLLFPVLPDSLIGAPRPERGLPCPRVGHILEGLLSEVGEEVKEQREPQQGLSVSWKAGVGSWGVGSGWFSAGVCKLYANH